MNSNGNENCDEPVQKKSRYSFATVTSSETEFLSCVGSSSVYSLPTITSSETKFLSCVGSSKEDLSKNNEACSPSCLLDDYDEAGSANGALNVDSSRAALCKLNENNVNFVLRFEEAILPLLLISYYDLKKQFLSELFCV